MFGNAHIPDEDLALYAEGSDRTRNASEIERHLETCEECFLSVVIQRELLDAEDGGLFDALFAAATPTATPAPNPSRRKDTTPKSAPPAGGLFGIGAILAGALGFSKLAGHHALPSLASSAAHSADDPDGTAGSFSSPHVRNPPFGSSEDADGGGHIHHDHQSPPEMRGHDMGVTDESVVFREADKTFGTPQMPGRSEYIHQQYPDTCAVQCQRLILNQFGIGVTEDQLAHEAANLGLYVPGHGTQLDDVGKLLEAHGLQIHREMNANVFNLATELAQGHKVIVGLDSGELWQTNSILESIADALGIGGADHAVIVSGIDTHDPSHVRVIVTDPGTGDVAKSYPLADFLDAWKGSHFSMVATADPAPKIDPGMVNFDWNTGHLPLVGAMPYELVHEMSDTATHASDPSVLHRLENAFMHVVSGEVPVSDLVHGLASSLAPGHFSFHNMATGLAQLAHHGMNADGFGALFSSLTGHEFGQIFHHEGFGHDLAHHDAHHSDSMHTDTAHQDSAADHHDPPDHDLFGSDS